ncbi:MAG: type II toxin-antitoxin system HicA family toxin [Gemmatimonadota bacterium]|nr:type II toxin-antitoxin system HicA family toxin [Gemmatimonadota bacterium]
MPTVREAIRLVERDGWHLARTRGSHRIFKHPAKSGIVVVAGNLGLDLPPGTWKSIVRQAGLETRDI